MPDPPLGEDVAATAAPSGLIREAEFDALASLAAAAAPKEAGPGARSSGQGFQLPAWYVAGCLG